MSRAKALARLASLEAQRPAQRFVVRWEEDGRRYDRPPHEAGARPADPAENLGAATLILVRYTDEP